MNEINTYRMRVESRNGKCNWDASVTMTDESVTEMENEGQDDERLVTKTIGEKLLRIVNDTIRRFEDDGKVFAKGGERRSVIKGEIMHVKPKS